MPGVFVSYCRPSAQIAEQVASALSTIGYDVWRDDQLPAHRAYGDVIEEKLRAAKAVVVLWSAEACQSQWVRAEADYARQAGVLVQASLDGTIPPLPFNQIQCADLSDWKGDLQASGWQKIERSVAALAGPIEAIPTARNRTSEVSICVLPFANMSGDAEQEYFSDGICEDITTDLSKVSALAVTARNTAFMFKGQSIDVRDVARKLNVSHVLEGSVRKSGNRVRITAQLIDGGSGDHVWAERFDRDLTDIFAIQDEISRAIVDALKVKLLPAEKRAIEQRGTTNVDAYNYYLMARQTWIAGSHGDIRREETVLRSCDRAIEIEPNYAQAWGLKALVQAALHFNYKHGTEDGVAAAERALQLDPNVAEAYCVKARVLSAQRRFDEAEEQIRIAIELAPDLWEANNEAALIYYWWNKFPEAAHYYERCAELDQGERHALEMLMSVYDALGDDDGVERAAERLLKAAEAAVATSPNDAAALGAGAEALAMMGDVDRAKEWIDRALLIEPDNLGMRYNFVCSLLRRSDQLDLALEHLEYVYARSVGSIVRRADIDPDLDPIRNHPRYKKIYDAAVERIAKYDAENAKEATSQPGAT